MKLNRKIIIGIVASLTILIILVIFYFYLNNNKLSSTKRVDNLIITDTSIDYNGTIYILTANVKNNSKEVREDIKFKIIFYDKSNTEMTSTTGYLGDIKGKGMVELSAAISVDLKDVSNVKYEIIK